MKTRFIKNSLLLFQLLLICGNNILFAQSLKEQEIMPMIMRGVDIIDVRTDDEYKKSSIMSAIHIPFKQLEEKSGVLDKSKEYIISAASNKNCDKAITKLQELGFDKVYNGGKWTIIQSKNVSPNLEKTIKIML